MSATVDRVHASVYTVPTDAPGPDHTESDGTATWSATTLVLVEVGCGDLVGTGWTYGPPACAAIVRDVLADVVVGRPVDAVPAAWQAMVGAVRNSTRAGVAGYAISAVDVALWDLKARRLDVAAADLLGRAHERVAVYGSGGFTSYDDGQLADQLAGWAQQGIGRFKIKIGREPERDLERMALARTVIGPRAELFVDANGAYTTKQAVRVLTDANAAGADVCWFEEPVTSDDLDGLALVRGAVDADVAAGEYGSDVGYFRAMCAAGAVDCLQVDATRCGGWTEWLRASAVAQAHHLQVSAHCAPNLHAQVAAATANARHVEWFHDHARIEQMLFTGALDPTGGHVTPDAGQPGHGLTFDHGAAAAFTVDA